MPSPTARILKKPATTAYAAAPLDGSAFTAPLQRIPARQVACDTPPEEPVVRTGLIRRQQALVEARPVTLADFAAAPAYPLPPPAAERLAAEPAPPPVYIPSREEIDAAWQARLDAAVEKARQEGFEAGVAAATAELQVEVDALRDAFTEDLTRIEAAAAETFRRAEPLLAALAFEVAETILNARLPEPLRAVSERAITEAVERATGELSVDILLHPVDYLRLQESGIVDQLLVMHSGLRWHPNPDLKQGDWVVQTPTATTRRLEAELLATLRSRLGVHKNEGPDPST
jgi:flagellar assembly protein FliH